MPYIDGETYALVTVVVLPYRNGGLIGWFAADLLFHRLPSTDEHKGKALANRGTH
jgi:hypothetical protein